MALQFKFFTIRTADSQQEEAELNKFLKSVQVKSLHREFASQGDNSLRAKLFFNGSKGA